MVPLTPDAVALGQQQHASLQAAGIGHAVRLSVFQGVIDADLTLGQLHGALDADFRARGLTGAVLQPDSFMQNLLGSAPSIAAGSLQNATGQGRMGWIDVDDIAHVAAHILQQPSDATLLSADLTGPELLSHADVAERIGRWVCRSVVYEDLSPDALRSQLLSYGLPVFLATIFCELAAWTRDPSRIERLSPVVETLTGRAPRTLEQFLAANPDCFPQGAATL